MSSKKTGILGAIRLSFNGFCIGFFLPNLPVRTLWSFCLLHNFPLLDNTKYSLEYMPYPVHA